MAIGVCFASLSIEEINLLADHSGFETSNHWVYDSSEHTHSHSHHYFHDDLDSEPHDHEHTGDSDHKHSHVHIFNNIDFQLVVKEDFVDEQVFNLLSLNFFFLNFSFTHHPSEILRPPILSIV